MPRPAKQDGLSRSARYRASKRRAGMKLVRIWVPDPTAPGFAEEARRQAKLINDAPEEAEIMAWIEDNADWSDD